MAPLDVILTSFFINIYYGCISVTKVLLHRNFRKKYSLVFFRNIPLSITHVRVGIIHMQPEEYGLKV